jgi:hypothetical protein
MDERGQERHDQIYLYLALDIERREEAMEGPS